jgi:hypothetical protein
MHGHLTINMKSCIPLLAGAIFLANASVYGGDTGSSNAEHKKYPGLGLTQEQIVRHMESDFRFGPPKSKPNGLVALEAANRESRTLLVISKEGENVVLATVYFQPTTAHDDAAFKQIVKRTGILLRFLKNTVPEIAWDGPEESRAMGKIIGELSRQAGQHKREVGARMVVFRRATMEQPLIELHVHSKELGNQS